ncbi:MAG: hypothetical protein EOO40_00420 [Deltaproteobacteria bacterium]|nr:MAG: hypothetical protein EOO40_00420 [Deltaproteobacteria bacterium]
MMSAAFITQPIQYRIIGEHDTYTVETYSPEIDDGWRRDINNEHVDAATKTLTPAGIERVRSMYTGDAETVAGLTFKHAPEVLARVTA